VNSVGLEKRKGLQKLILSSNNRSLVSAAGSRSTDNLMAQMKKIKLNYAKVNKKMIEVGARTGLMTA
jgi:hypothetical protein